MWCVYNCIHRQARKFSCVVAAKSDVAPACLAQLERLGSIPGEAARPSTRAVPPPLAVLPRVWQQVPRRHRQVLHRMWRQETRRITGNSMWATSSLISSAGLCRRTGDRYWAPRTVQLMRPERQQLLWRAHVTYFTASKWCWRHTS